MTRTPANQSPGGSPLRKTPPAGGLTSSFVGEQIEVEHDRTPRFDKMPACPLRFTHRGATHRIAELLLEWRDYVQRPSADASALRKGSWGAGRDYYRVKTDSGRVFEIYYDRKPKGVAGRKGRWFLFQELRDPV